MESVALKRAVLVAVVCSLISFFLYWNLRKVTNDDTRRTEEKPSRKETPAKPLVPGKLSWSLDEVIDAYARQRDNAYLQYVMLQLARNENRTVQVAEQFPELFTPAPPPKVDLFNLFSGYHAIQESLQADLMLANTEQGEEPASAKAKAEPLEKLAGPTVKSHPWDTMLAGKKPKVSELSRCVPSDFYLVEFRTLTKLLDTLEAGHGWMTYFFTQAHLDATDLRTRQRIQTQLLLDDSPSQRSFYDAIVQSVAITGSDPFIKEGSDVTMLFTFQSASFFQGGMNRMQESARKQHSNLRIHKGKILGVEYTALTTPDRTVSLYYADPRAHLHLRSNSLVGLQRVLETTLGRSPSIGASAEFRYIRTLMPLGDLEEDGLIYLSDPFVRNLIGPKTKITEARRLVGYNHLRMISHAAQMYRTQFGKAPKTLADLEQANCTPGRFNAGRLACPLGGNYRLSDDGTHGISAMLGTTHFLTPCCELPTPDASPAEADAYGQFLGDYERYWQTYFDPIAIRLQTTTTHLRVETLVLPLIGNSIYTALAQVVGPHPEPLDALPIPPRNLFSLNLRLNREMLMQSIGKPARLQRAKVVHAVNAFAMSAASFYPSNLALLDDLKNVEPMPAPYQQEGFKKLGFSQEKLEALLDKGVGNQIGIHYYDAKIMFDLNLTQFLGSLFQEMARNGFTPSEPLDDIKTLELLGSMAGTAYLASSLIVPVYLAVPVQDAKIVDAFLDHLDPVLSKAATHRAGRSGGLHFDAGADFYHLQNKFGTKVRTFGLRYGPLRYRLHWARIGAGLYLTNQIQVLEDLHAAHTQPLKSRSPPVGPTGHALLRLRAENGKQALDGYKLGWAENNREACQRNLSMLSAASRAFSASPPVSKLAAIEEDRERLVFHYARKMYGVEFACPDGGRYVLSDDGKTCPCTVHGTLDHPKQTTAPAKNSPIDRLMRDFKDLHATLTILPEGLRAVVVIERK